MRLKKIGVALLATLALASFAASAANAAEWYVAGTKLSGSTGVSASIKSEKFVLTSTVLGSPFKLTATGLECEGCTISNPEAVSAGKLKFTGVTVDEPAGCSVATTLTTNALKDKVIMGVSSGTFDKFEPVESGGAFITIKVEGCAAAGSYKVKGSATGRSNETGTAAVTQPLAFSAANQTAGGGSLTLGTEAAQLTGEANNVLTGSNAGKTYEAK